MSGGDVNGFFGLVVDNLSILGFIATALIGIYGFPAEIVFTRMFPGTAFGVLVGNLIYARMAANLARREGRDDVTAMPLGLDAPTSIGMALLVLGPAYVGFHERAGYDPATAAIMTWQLGMASLVVMGVFKFTLSFFGDLVQKQRAACGLARLDCRHRPDADRLPAAGRNPARADRRPGRTRHRAVCADRQGPPAVRDARRTRRLRCRRACSISVSDRAVCSAADSMSPAAVAVPLRPALARHSVSSTALPLTIPYLPLLLPFGLLMIIGGINVTESARAAGDDYSTRNILLAESVSTLVAGLCGGVAQTTPYIGQPAYKAMGARISYVVLTGLFIGFGGIFGYLSDIVETLPFAVLAPILVFVAISIMTQAFEATPTRYAAAVVFAFFPAIARLLAIKLGDPGDRRCGAFRSAVQRRQPRHFRSRHDRRPRQWLHHHLDALGQLRGRPDRRPLRRARWSCCSPRC